MVRRIIVALCLWLAAGLVQAAPINGMLSAQSGGGLLSEASSWNGRGNFIRYAVTTQHGQWQYDYFFGLRSEDISFVTLGFAGGYADPIATSQTAVLSGLSGTVGEWTSGGFPSGVILSGIRFDFVSGDLLRFSGATYGLITVLSPVAPMWGDVLFLGQQGSLAYNARFGDVIGASYSDGVVWGKIPVPGELVVSTVPEPNSAFMMLSGIGLLGFSLRKKLQS